MADQVVEVEVHENAEQREPLVQQNKVPAEAQQPPADVEGGGEAAALPGGPPQLGGAAQQPQERN